MIKMEQNKNKIEMPDIDTDFPDNRREEIIKYASKIDLPDMNVDFRFIDFIEENFGRNRSVKEI